MRDAFYPLTATAIAAWVGTTRLIDNVLLAVAIAITTPRSVFNLCVVYSPQMSLARQLLVRLAAPVAAVLIGTCALVTAATGQATSAGLPADCSGYTAIPLPAEAERTPVPKATPACASYRSYRGIGRPVNYSEARACAWQERLAQKADLAQNEREPLAWVVGGSLILADIYFNGAGVKRDIPLAIRFACESEEAMAALALPAIAKLKGSPPADKSFEFCDYAATTFTMNFCGGYASAVEDARRTHFYESLKDSMPAEQRLAFEKLLAAHSAYIEAHASEVYQGGTIRVVRTLGSQRILKDRFHTQLTHCERRKWPVLQDQQIASAGALLRGEYDKKLRQLRTQTKEEIEEGNVTAANLTSVETTWETYRDAWVAFARLRYPAAVAAIQAEITLDRYHLLKTINSSELP